MTTPEQQEPTMDEMLESIYRIVGDENITKTRNFLADDEKEDGESSIDYKYSEDIIFEELKNYIDSTYDQHYATEDKKTQILDYLSSLDIAEDFCRANVIKYVARFGKKEGKNRKDLLKALHYTVLLLHFSFEKSTE